MDAHGASKANATVVVVVVLVPLARKVDSLAAFRHGPRREEDALDAGVHRTLHDQIEVGLVSVRAAVRAGRKALVQQALLYCFWFSTG